MTTKTLLEAAENMVAVHDRHVEAGERNELDDDAAFAEWCAAVDELRAAVEREKVQ